MVGAGLVGTACALALVRAGRTVILIEARPAAPEPTGDARALVLAPASLAVLGELGLWGALAHRAHAITAILVSDRGGVLRAELDAASAGLDALGYACPADWLLHVQDAHAQEALGARFLRGAVYQGHRAGDDAVDVDYLDADGATRTARCALVVGADGGESAVRAGLGIDVERYDYGQSAVIAPIEVEQPVAGMAFEHFTSEGPLALIPQGGARYVSVQCLESARADAALAAGDAAYGAMLERRFGTRLGTIRVCGPRRAHALARQRARAITAPRAVLIGNAANTMHPNGAQGLNLGLRDVAALVHHVGASGDAGAPAVLDAYAAARTRDQRRTVGFTDLLAQGFRSPLGLVRGARRLALAALAACPPLKRALILEASGLAALARSRH